MAVLVEAISVIVRRARLDASYPGGWNRFVADCPNKSLCSDRDLGRIGFMSPTDVEAFVRQLEAAGLVYLRNGEAVDIAVVDQLRGPASRCDWLEFGHVGIQGNRIATCRLAGSTEDVLITPDGWHYAESLSATYGFVPVGSEKESLRFLRHENGMDVYFNYLTGKEVYISRTAERKSQEEQPDVPRKNQ